MPYYYRDTRPTWSKYLEAILHPKTHLGALELHALADLIQRPYLVYVPGAKPVRFGQVNNAVDPIRTALQLDHYQLINGIDTFTQLECKTGPYSGYKGGAARHQPYATSTFVPDALVSAGPCWAFSPNAQRMPVLTNPLPQTHDAISGFMSSMPNKWRPGDLTSALLMPVASENLFNAPSEVAGHIQSKPPKKHICQTPGKRFICKTIEGHLIALDVPKDHLPKLMNLSIGRVHCFTCLQIKEIMHDTQPGQYLTAQLETTDDTVGSLCTQHNPFSPNHAIPVLDLFSGCGGFSVAAVAIGAYPIAAIEKDPWVAQLRDVIMRQTYDAFSGSASQLTRRVDLQGAPYLTKPTLIGTISECMYDIKALEPNNVIITAGFPCQPYSKFGTEGGVDTTEGKVVSQLLNAIYSTRPPAFLLENVVAFLINKRGMTAKRLFTALRDAGYAIMAYIHQASNLVPQSRTRIYVVGIRKDIFIQARKNNPNRLDTYIGFCPPAWVEVEVGEHQPKPKYGGPRKARHNQWINQVRQSELTRLIWTPDHKRYYSNPQYLPHGKTVDHRRLSLDDQLYTVTTKYSEPHTIGLKSLREKKLLAQGLPIGPNDARHFHPTEVARSLGYPTTTHFDITTAHDLSFPNLQYHALGNSISILCVAWELNRIKAILTIAEGTQLPSETGLLRFVRKLAQDAGIRIDLDPNQAFSRDKLGWPRTMLSNRGTVIDTTLIYAPMRRILGFLTPTYEWQHTISMIVHHKLMHALHGNGCG